VLAGPAGPIELDVQQLIHRRGTTLLGVATTKGACGDEPSDPAATGVEPS
jgi:hypothetical protein